MNVCCIAAVGRPSSCPAVRDGGAACGRRVRGTTPWCIGSTATTLRRLAHGVGVGRRRRRWRWLVGRLVAEAVDLFNRYSPHFVASLISDDADEHDRFYAPSMPRSSATDSPAGSMGSSPSTARARPVQLAGRPAVRPWRRAVGRLGVHRAAPCRGARPLRSSLTVGSLPVHRRTGGSAPDRLPCCLRVTTTPE